MSNNASDYKNNLVFIPKEDQTVGDPDEKLKGTVQPLSAQVISNIRDEARLAVDTVSTSSSCESRSDREKAKMKQILKECYNLFAREQCSGCGLSMSELVEICTKIEEVLR